MNSKWRKCTVCGAQFVNSYVMCPNCSMQQKAKDKDKDKKEEKDKNRLRKIENNNKSQVRIG